MNRPSRRKFAGYAVLGAGFGTLCWAVGLSACGLGTAWKQWDLTLALLVAGALGPAAIVGSVYLVWRHLWLTETRKEK